jgi:anti-sigma B factor antagonist
MEITERQVDGVSILVLSGDIDLETSPALRSVLQKREPGPLVVDFTAVAYIDSSGLATLIEYYQKTGKAARAAGHERPPSQVVLAGLSPRVRGAFELVRLNEIFPAHSGVDEAVVAIRALLG